MLVEREAMGNRTAELDYRGGQVCRQRRSWQAGQLRRFPWCLWLLWSSSGFWGGGWRVEAGVCGGRECAELEFWPVGPPMVDTESRKYSLKSAAWVPDGVAMVDNRAAAGE